MPNQNFFGLWLQIIFEKELLFMIHAHYIKYLYLLCEVVGCRMEEGDPLTWIRTR